MIIKLPYYASYVEVFDDGVSTGKFAYLMHDVWVNPKLYSMEEATEKPYVEIVEGG